MLLGDARLPRFVAASGVAFIACGTAFDMFATFFHTPSLSAEANVIARAFIDAGYGLKFIYAYAILSQGLFVLFLSISWLAFLKHRKQIVQSIGQPKTIVDLIEAGVGIGHLPKRKMWTLNIHINELPRAYHLFWIMVVLLVGGELDSWYLGLEWFNLTNSLRWEVNSFAFISTLLIYFTWLWYASHKINCSH